MVRASIEHDMPQWTSQIIAHSTTRHRKTRALRDSGRDVFSLVTGKGKRPSSSAGSAYRFSLRLAGGAAVVVVEEWVEPADEVERFVFLRSRMLTEFGWL